MHFPPFSLPQLFATAALFVCSPAFSAANDATPPEPATAVILTPQAPPEPRINGPVVFGARPGHSFLYSIPATGRRPMRFAASDLPAGLMLDAETGRISGQVSAPGEYRVTLRAQRAFRECGFPIRPPELECRARSELVWHQAGHRQRNICNPVRHLDRD